MQVKDYLNKIAGQSHLLGRWWGNLNTIAQHTNIYIQFLILAFSATSAYAVLMQTLHQWGYEMPFWMFALLVILSIAILALFVWRLSIPSTFETWNYQWWHHGSFLKPKIEQLEKDNIEMKEQLNRIEKLLEKNADERINKVYSKKG